MGWSRQLPEAVRSVRLGLHEGERMNIGMLTLDDTNLDNAQQFAANHGSTVQGWLPKDGSPNGRFDALVYDLDHWTCNRRDRARLVCDLSTHPPAVPVAVHSYALEPRQVRALRRNGVLV